MNTNIRRKHAFNAIKAGNLKRLETLVTSHKDANWRLPKQPLSLLDVAVEAGKCDVVRWLLVHGANPNTLHGPYESMEARYLLSPISFYFSPLATAIQIEDAEMVRILLDAGADLALPKSILMGLIKTCDDALKKNAAFASKVESLAISASLHGQTTSSNCLKASSRRSL